MYNFRTDLALERNDIYKKQNNLSSEIDGIEVNEESKENIKISRVKKDLFFIGPFCPTETYLICVANKR